MPYPPIPRDANGNPIPVIWDDGIGSWRVYTGTIDIKDRDSRKLGQITLVDKNGVPFDNENALPIKGEVTLSGTLAELYGASLSDRPPANSVSVGATFMVVGDTVVYQSNGSDWVVISE